MSDMEEDEDYGFEYETDDDEEQDVDIENQVSDWAVCKIMADGKSVPSPLSSKQIRQF